MKAWISAFALVLFAVLAQGQNKTMSPTDLALQRLIQEKALVNGEMAFLAINLDNGRVIADYHSDRSMVPASIQKLVTTAVAIEQLGPYFQYKTIIQSDGTAGNIYVRGAGDPTLNSRYNMGEESDLDKIKSKISGIGTAESKIIIDASHFSRYTTSRGWIWEDMGNYFGASPSALMWNDNMLEVNLRSGQAGTRAVLADPVLEGLGYEVDVQVMAAESNKDDAWFFGAPGSNLIYALGTIPAHRSKFLVKAAHPDPMGQFGRDIAKDRQVEIEYTKVDRSNLEPVMELLSDPLYVIIKQTNQMSINLYAEALSLELDEADIYKTIDGANASIEAFLKSRKINLKGTRRIDGSGLSPLNRTTCYSMVDVLTMMYRSENKDFFMGSLPVGGESGTIAGYFKGGKAQGNIKAKSGTMAGVRNYAGYVQNKYDETIAFCLMINDYDDKERAEVMKQVEALIEAIIED